VLKLDPYFDFSGVECLGTHFKAILQRIVKLCTDSAIPLRHLGVLCLFLNTPVDSTLVLVARCRISSCFISIGSSRRQSCCGCRGIGVNVQIILCIRFSSGNEFISSGI